jgi:hypothetical protein
VCQGLRSAPGPIRTALPGAVQGQGLRHVTRMGRFEGFGPARRAWLDCKLVAHSNWLSGVPGALGQVGWIC